MQQNKSSGDKARAFVTLFFTLYLSVFAVHPGRAQTDKNGVTDRPNVILILADDMGLGDIAAINGGLNLTPVLDSLKKEGFWFSQGYSSSPVCAPARATLLTGMYPHKAGVVTLNVNRWPELTRIYKSHTTIADMFKGNGYKTALIGKWHTGEGREYHPLSRGFDEFMGFKGYQVKGYSEFGFEVNGASTMKRGEYLTDVLTEYAIEYVRDNQASPFFLFLSHFAPHRPLEAPGELVSFYRDKGYDENTSLVYAMVEVMDRGIGRLLGELERLGMRERTLIIFASDNGPDPLTGTRYNCELKGQKYSVHEGGIRVPIIFNRRNAIRAGESSQVAHFTDIVPTLVEMCHLDIAENVRRKFDGGSLVNVINHRPDNELPSPRFWQWNRGVPHYSHNAAIREGDWKLVRPFATEDAVLPSDAVMRSLDPAARREIMRALTAAVGAVPGATGVGAIPDGKNARDSVLYNLKNDPEESRNMRLESPEVYDNLKVKLEDWCRRMEYYRIKYRDGN